MKRQVGAIWTWVLCFLVTVAFSVPVSAAGPKPKDFVSYNGRIAPDEAGSFDIPAGRILVITDVVIQNRQAGDAPVDPSQFTTVALSGDPYDISLNIVGNDGLVLHFATGIRVNTMFPRIANLGTSTAPLIEYLINGYLTKPPKGF